MRTHEKWAVAVAAAALVSPFLSIALSGSLDSQPWANSWWWGMLGGLLGGLAIRVVVGLWLYYTARRDGHSPIVWFALGAVFSILAAILYFLLRALDREALTSRPRGSAAQHSNNPGVGP